MEKIYRTVLIGCGRMGSTIDDEVRDHPRSALWLPYSRPVACIARERTEERRPAFSARRSWGVKLCSGSSNRTETA